MKYFVGQKDKGYSFRGYATKFWGVLGKHGIFSRVIYETDSWFDALQTVKEANRYPERFRDIRPGKGDNGN